MNDWPEIHAWRVAQRRELIAKRKRIPEGDRQAADAAIRVRLRDNFAELADAAVGFYWPINGEVDLRPLVRDLIAEGASAGLPVVVKNNQPLEFWEWRPDYKMNRGFSRIPIPDERKLMLPGILLIPLVGFDVSGHRLGYGGGYFDRTLEEYRLKPLTIGVGYDCGCLETIFPQAHDIPLDAIVTETRQLRLDNSPPADAGVSSPPCHAREFDSETDL